MPSPSAELMQALGCALGGGLLVGMQRERSRQAQPEHTPGGIRTFTMAALAGAVAALMGHIVVAGAGVAIGVIAALPWSTSSDTGAGYSSKLALVSTFLLGALATQQMHLAAALFVAIAALLHAKESLHHFTRHVLSESELGDVLILAISILIILPLLPDTAVDPWAAVNPRQVWLIAVFVMAIAALGQVGLRLFGAGRGLAMVGFLAGFVSSGATIASMGQRAAADPRTLAACTSAALLSCVATVVQLALVIGVVSPPLLRSLALPLLMATGMTVGVAAFSFWRNGHTPADVALPALAGRFALRHAVLFAGIVALSLIATAWLRDALGHYGVVATAAMTGFVDVHAAAASLANLVQSDAATAHDARTALAAAFTANSIMKCVASLVGGLAYARRIILGVIAINAALIAALYIP